MAKSKLSPEDLILNQKIKDLKRQGLIDDREATVLLERRTQLQQDYVSYSQDLGGILQELYGLKSSIYDVEKSSLKTNLDISREIQRHAYESRTVEQSQDKINKFKELENKARVNSVLIEKQMSPALLKNVKDAATRGKNLEKERDALDKKKMAIEAIYMRGEKVSQQELESLINSEKSIHTKEKDLATRIKNLTPAQQEALLARQAHNSAVALGKKETERLKMLTSIENSMGLSGKMLSLFNKTGLDTSKITKNVRSNMEKIAKVDPKAVEGLKGKFIGILLTVKEIGKAIVDALIDPMTYLIIMLENQKAVTEFGKQFGVGYWHSFKMRHQMSLIAMESNDVFITSKKTQEAMGQMNKEFGFVMDYSGETLETMVNLNQRIGMGAKESAVMTGLFKLQGNNTEEIAANTMQSYQALKNSATVAMTEMQIMDKVAKSSAAVKVSLQASPEAIGKAVIKAKELGLELSQVESIGKGLLDFETSIGKELEAELLTGKELYLEKARLYALTNDFEALGEEIGKQGIDMVSYGKMNYKQQEALAGALSLSREAMSDMLLNQELQGLSAEEIKNNYSEDVYNQYKRLDAAEKFTAAVEKLKGLFSDIMVILDPIMFVFGKLADFAGSTIGSFMLLGGALGAVVVAVKALLPMMTGLFMKTVGMSIWQIISGFVKWLGPIGWGVGAGAVIGTAAMAYQYMKKSDDSIIPGVGAGYGKRMLYEPDTLTVTAYNDKDTIIAGTNIHKRNAAIDPPVGVSEAAVSNIISGDKEINYGKMSDSMANAMSRVRPTHNTIVFDQMEATYVNAENNIIYDQSKMQLDA